MRKRGMLFSIMLIGILFGSMNYLSVDAQKANNNNNNNNAQTNTQSTFRLQFMTIPQKLIHDTDATLLIYAVDNNGKPLPIRIPTVSVTSSDPSVVKIRDVYSSEFDNSVRVDIYAGKIGTATITAAAGGFISSSVNLEVVGDAYKPEGLLVKAVPSSFAHFGPYNGYVAIQLVNFFGNPVPANEDITINLSSSDQSVVPLNKQVVIKRGENFIVESFSVRGSGITLLQAEVPGKWKESARVSVSQPDMPLRLNFYAAPQIAPAMQGQKVFGFVQLQDANGRPVKAEQSISVNVFSDSSDIRASTGVIQKGSTTTVVELTVNTNNDCSATGVDRAPKNDNFNPCIELVAVSKGFKSQSQLVELRKPITRVDLNPDTRFDDPSYVKIDPIFFPTFIDTEGSQENLNDAVNMPLLSDGSDQFIGVVQLMKFVDSDEDGMIDLKNAVPAIPFVDVNPVIEADDDFMMEVKSTTIEKGDSSALIRARVGYQGGTSELTAVAEFFGQSFTKFMMHGHQDIALAVEPMVPKVMAKTSFPIAVYFKDSDGRAANSIGDMTLSISHADNAEAEIGTSKTTTDILEIETDVMRKGSSIMLLSATSKGKGSSTVTVEGSVKDKTFSTSSTINMSTQLPEKLQLFIPATVLGNAKYTVPLQVLDKDGFPIKTVEDAEVLFVPSIRNVISAPEKITLPKDEYYTTLLVEAQSDGKTEITALANNFQSTKINVEVTTPEPTLSLKAVKNMVKPNEEFTVTLESEYMGVPIRDLEIEWSSDKASLLSGPRFTSSEGTATASFLAAEAGNFVVEAEVSGPGYKTKTASVNMQIEAPPIQNIAPGEIPGRVLPDIEDRSIGGVLTSNMHFFLIPAIGGVLFWLVKSEQMPFGNILGRFRGEEEEEEYEDEY